MGGHEKVAMLLLEQGADPKAKDSEGQTVLMSAHCNQRPGELPQDFCNTFGMSGSGPQGVGMPQY